MTSEIDVSKTNEFLRRRKLRLQQVREQSKDIAKKIRQRAKVEKLRHGIDVDAKKETEYFECQEKLVKRLELLYSKSLQNVGASHKNALEVNQTVENIDLSKLRGKEAVIELRKRKQEKLNEQKKILDRKLQARELANELSREKSSNVAKNLTKQAKKDHSPNKPERNSIYINDKDKTQNKDSAKLNPDVTKTDMATQWEFAELPNEWEPNIPTLSLPKDDTAKDTVENLEKSDKNKRPNLFALSDEMPSSLRGGLSSVIEETIPLKPSLTLVSEYLQNRNLKLREFEPVKRTTDDLQNIKQTIIHTRALRADGSISDNICHVLDKQIKPVPSWQAEYNNGFGDHQYIPYAHLPLKCMSHFPNNNLHAALQPHKQCSQSKQNFKWSSRFMKHIFGTIPVSGKDKSARSTDADIILARKKSISVYNHNTRDIVDVPYNEDGFVIQDKKSEEDAYAQALQETTSTNNTEREQLNKSQKDMRNKIAVTRQNVDKEYRDTLAFLNSLPKDTGNKPIKTTYMDDHQQQLEQEKHQRKMQLEFKKIERECRKQNCKHNKRKTVLENKRSESKSPVNDVQHRKVFEYSWMPVPESDGNLAIHTLPTTTRKSGNTVKFTEPNTYHEYRSRHKHTPPTKDNNQKQMKVVETLILQNSNESDENDNVSETSSIENLSLDKEKTGDSDLRDAERIIIYKILDSRNKKKCHKNLETKIDNGKSVHSNEIPSTIINSDKEKQGFTNLQQNCKGVDSQNLHEGIYKGVSSKGDNIASVYFSEDPKDSEALNRSRQTDNFCQSCHSKNIDPNGHYKDLHKEDGGDNKSRATKPVCLYCGKDNEKGLSVQPSAATSTTSFKTAPNDKNNFPINPESGFIKMVDEEGQETGKFYIGASGFIKDDNYEVVIQLRKKEGEKATSQETMDAHLPVNISEKSNLQTTQDNNLNIIEKANSDSLSKSLKEKSISSVPANVTINLETNKVVDAIDNIDQRSLNKEKLDDKVTEPTSRTQTKTCEKAVHTSFEDTYAVPMHAPKSDPLPRPATSTYTQTSFCSSLPRPNFMHMSSSTSTAYMSPPELVLPNFLKQDHVMTHDELFESENTVNHTDTQYEVLEEACEDYECRCKRCTCVNKIGVKCRLRNATSTPPNTARSFIRHELTNNMKGKKKRKCKCNKCSKHSETKICHKSHRKRVNSEDVRSSRDVTCDNKNAKPVQNGHKLSARSAHNKVDRNGNKINPVVKNYVNKLLSLNKEGLKAIEIINQDCSIASTPGSSIINVPSNTEVKQSPTNQLHNKISLEQIKNVLKDQILKENYKEDNNNIKKSKVKTTENQIEKVPKSVSRLSKKKSVHKVKLLNISRQLLNKKKLEPRRQIYSSKNTTSTSSSTREEKKVILVDHNNYKSRSKSSHIPRSFENSEYKNTSSDIAEPTFNMLKQAIKNWNVQKNYNNHLSKSNSKSQTSNIANNQTKTRSVRPKPSYISSDSEVPSIVLKHLSASRSPTKLSTQTNGSIDVETNFMKLAEDKLQNMEKIADLTEKCTKRLSNLAKVLEEVRKNKSLVYSQISTSDSASEAENKSDKSEIIEKSNFMPQANIIIQNKQTQLPLQSPIISENLDEKLKNELFIKDSIEFTPILKDIPKPNSFLVSSNEVNPVNDKTIHSSNIQIEPLGVKARGRPPAALSRINLKSGQEFCVTPHELSTVIEVDSPMSIKFKNQTSRQYENLELPDKSNQIIDFNDKEDKTTVKSPILIKEPRIDPDLLQSNTTSSRHQPKMLTTESSDDSRTHPLDLKQFNDIMLKPFISLQEYAQQCNIGLDEGSNIEDLIKDDLVNDELSSLHSDGSLPDVIAELLKRKMISEPFRFDSASNVNSTTLSSESTVSILALTKTRKHKRKSGILQKNKGSIGETSETLSISSNPDLENAFQKLGMGWASSTLKKTKERLALSSSSNTSSSSMTQFKIRTFSQDVPTLVTDSTSSLLDFSNKRDKKLPPGGNTENSKNTAQQTSLMNSMTVKEFLTNELAKKITFSNKTTRKEAEDEFMSLYETNIPENLKNTNVEIDEGDDQSVVSANNNRARTSTPVQIYKSTTYNSTSSSNASNGLFSHADDLSSVKVTSTSIRNHSTSDKDDLTIPNYTLKTRKELSDYSKSD